MQKTFLTIINSINSIITIINKRIKQKQLEKNVTVLETIFEPYALQNRTWSESNEKLRKDPEGNPEFACGNFLNLFKISIAWAKLS